MSCDVICICIIYIQVYTGQLCQDLYYQYVCGFCRFSLCVCLFVSESSEMFCSAKGCWCGGCFRVSSISVSSFYYSTVMYCIGLLLLIDSFLDVHATMFSRGDSLKFASACCLFRNVGILGKQCNNELAATELSTHEA